MKRWRRSYDARAAKIKRFAARARGGPSGFLDEEGTSGEVPRA